jgi:hypothetical protein
MPTFPKSLLVELSGRLSMRACCPRAGPPRTGRRGPRLSRLYSSEVSIRMLVKNPRLLGPIPLIGRETRTTVYVRQGDN